MQKLRQLGRLLGLHFLGGRRTWHNRVFDERFACIADKDRPYHGSLVWDQNIVLPVVHAAAGLGTCNLEAGCNIIASGPSLLQVPDRERLLDRFSVVVNGAYAAVERGARRFDLYVVTDHRFVRNDWDRLCAGLEASHMFATHHHIYMEILKRDPRVLADRRLMLFTNLNRPYLGPRLEREASYNSPDVRVLRQHVACCFDPAVGAFTGRTVVFFCLQLTCGWGFRDIYLWGVDMTGGARNYVEAAPAPSYLLSCLDDEILPSFRLAAQMASERGIRLWNCSPVSRLPVEFFPRLEPDVAFKGSTGGISP